MNLPVYSQDLMLGRRKHLPSQTSIDAISRLHTTKMPYTIQPQNILSEIHCGWMSSSTQINPIVQKINVLGKKPMLTVPLALIVHRCGVELGGRLIGGPFHMEPPIDDLQCGS